MTGVRSVDHLALAPTYLAALTAVAALVVDLLLPGRRAPVLITGAAGTVAVALAAVLVGTGGRRATFCTGAGTLPGGIRVPSSCSYVLDSTGALVAVLFAGITLAVLGLSVPMLRAGVAPAGEYVFLLAASLTGGVVLGCARDLVTLIVAVETLTLPLYVLLALRRRIPPDPVASGSVTPGPAVAGPGNRAPAADPGPAEAAAGAVSFFVVSVVSTAVTLMGAALLYALTGAVHLDRIAAALAQRPELRHVPLTSAAVLLVLVGFGVKAAAVPFHGWAPASYDGAPLPVAAYLSTASKLGGVVALLYVGLLAARPWWAVTGPTFAVLAVASTTVGNLVALRQHRMVRLLAFSSVAQTGYLLAPLGAVSMLAARQPAVLRTLVAATLGYTVFYLLLELGAFGALVGLRGARSGGQLDDYRGTGRRHRTYGAALALALIGLAGLPPGLAGLFAKVTVVRATLHGGAGWLAVLIALNVVLGLAYYLRAAVLLYRPGTPAPPSSSGRPVLPVLLVVAAVTGAAVLVGVWPQWVLSAAGRAADLFG